MPDVRSGIPTAEGTEATTPIPWEAGLHRSRYSSSMKCKHPPTMGWGSEMTFIFNKVQILPFQMLSFLFHFFLLSVLKRRSFLSGSNMEKGWDDPIPGS